MKTQPLLLFERENLQAAVPEQVGDEDPANIRMLCRAIYPGVRAWLALVLKQVVGVGGRLLTKKKKGASSVILGQPQQTRYAQNRV